MKNLTAILKKTVSPDGFTQGEKALKETVSPDGSTQGEKAVKGQWHQMALLKVRKIVKG